MNLHINKDLFRDAITASSQHMNIREVFIEKDYWVTYILKKISESDYNKITVFKGGTALSKAYKLIKRFSEDVDLTVIIPAGFDENQIEKLIISMEKEVTLDFNEIVIKDLTTKTKRYRRTLHFYDKIGRSGFSDADFGQATDKIMLEINSYGTTHPHKQMAISSYIADYLIEKNSWQEINKFGLQPFSLLVLDINRTMVEKITAIARAGFYANSIEELIKRIRHIYDICMMYQDSNIRRFLESNEFYELLDLVDEEDRNNPFVPDETIGLPFIDAKIFSEPENTWKELEPAYNTKFKPLVFGALPGSQDIVKCLSFLHTRLSEYSKYRRNI